MINAQPIRHLATVKSQMQRTRFALKALGVGAPKSLAMLDLWVGMFGYGKWQEFIRRTLSESQSLEMTLSTNTFDDFVLRLHKALPAFSRDQILSALRVALSKGSS